MNCIVTGGAGFIGSNLVNRLVDDGHTVVILDDFSTGKRENVHKKARVIEVDICKLEDLKKLKYLWVFADVVFHLAARPRVQLSIDKPSETNSANITGTLNVLMCCKKYGVKRVVYSSSSSLYGDQPTLPLKESMKPNPMSPYALQKLTGEEYCRLFNSLYGMETISLRYFNVFGPNQDPGGGYACMIPKFIMKIYCDESPVIFGDGKNTRDFTYINDVVDANIICGFTKKNVFGQVFNIGGGQNYSVNNVTDMIKKIANKENIVPKHIDPVVEARDTLADISRAETMLEWAPKIKLEDGLRLTYDHIVEKYITGTKKEDK